MGAMGWATQAVCVASRGVEGQPESRALSLSQAQRGLRVSGRPDPPPGGGGEAHQQCALLPPPPRKVPPTHPLFQPARAPLAARRAHAQPAEKR